VRTHADLCVLMPETAMQVLGWPLSEKAQADIDDKKRKASARSASRPCATRWNSRSAPARRGFGKVVLVYPAERMNTITANTLLKTLEEPPGDVRFVLASEAAHQLLPTIRSRCLATRCAGPSRRGDGLAGRGGRCGRRCRPVLLRAAGGRPEEALAPGTRPARRQAVVAAAQGDGRGDVAALGDCHAGPGGRHPAEDLPRPGRRARRRGARGSSRPATCRRAPGAGPGRGGGTGREQRTAEHPFNAGLMLESLVSRARSALHSTR
jgi:DNA polymerase-3 subunit delta'